MFLIVFLSLSFSTILSIETPVKFNSKEMFQSSTSSITNKTLQRMKYSWQEPAPVNIEDMRYITLKHWGFDGKIHVGEIIVHKLVADEVIEIFEKLFETMFPIERMKLVDDYQGSDDKSILANNCYALCVRYVAETNRWSKHAFGLAIDINPQQNPFYFPHRYGIGRGFVQPTDLFGLKYYNRNLREPGMIYPGGFIYSLFIKKGWVWGGECFEEEGFYDYHHFEKRITGINI